MKEPMSPSPQNRRCPRLSELPSPPSDKVGWPWTEESTRLPDIRPNGCPWPRVSIIMPSYNQGAYIEEAIRSVLLQGYPDLELIVIDGGSTDDAVDVIRRYEPWLADWVSENDRGQSHAINKGLARSTGQYFNWHNSDDLLTRNSIAMAVDVMLRYPESSYVHGYRTIIDENGNFTGHSYPKWHLQPNEVMVGVPVLRESIVALKSGIQPGCLMDRKLVNEMSGLDEKLHYVMDCDLLLRIALCRPPVYVGRSLVLYREHNGAKSLQWNVQRAKERLQIARKLFREPNTAEMFQDVRQDTFATAHRFACLGYAGIGKESTALWHLFLDIIYSPFSAWMARRRILIEILEQHPGRRLWLFPTLLRLFNRLFGIASRISPQLQKGNS